MAISLDGFIASADGSVHWLQAYDPYALDFGEFLDAVDAIVMGRKSYEQMLTFGPWPYTGKHTIVMSRQPLMPATPDTESSQATAAVVAEMLRREEAADTWIFGGGEIARTFLAAGCLDTLELCVVPILVGAGIPLFGPGTIPETLMLTKSRTYAHGLVRLDYDVMHGQ